MQQATSQRRLWLKFALAGPLAVLALALVLAANLGFLRARALENGGQLARSYTTVLVDHMTSELADTRTTLDRLAQALGRSRGVSDGAFAAAAREALVHQPGLDRLWVANAQGRVLLDTHPTAALEDVAAREDFRIYATEPARHMHLGVAEFDTRSGQWFVPVTQVVRDAQGTPVAVLGAFLDAERWLAMWQSLEVGAGGTVALLRASGELVMSLPFLSQQVGRAPEAGSDFLAALQRGETGVFSAASPLDGVLRVFAFARVRQGDDFVLVVGLDRAEVLAPWEQTVRQTLWLAAVLLALGVALTWSLYVNMTRRLAAEQAARLRAQALDSITQGVLVADAQGRTLSVNHAFETLTGYTQAQMLGRSCALLQGAGTDPATAQLLRDALARRAPVECRILNYRQDGRAFWNDLSIAPVHDAHGDVTHFVGVQRDVTQQQEAYLATLLMQSVFQQAREGITVTDAAGNIQRVNTAFTAITGYSEDEVRGKNPRVLASGLQDRAFYDAMWRDILERGLWSGEIYNRRKDGTVYPEWLTITVLRDERGEISHFIGSFDDLSQLRASENRVHQLAHFDPLTGLPNQTVLQDRTGHAITMAQRMKEPLCLMQLSIDHFKTVNDSHGHAMGDMVLIEVARRLSAEVREQDTVSHQAGNEFSLLLPATGSDGAAHLAGELLWSLAQPYVLGGQSFSLTASIGIASYPENGQDFEVLAKCAAIALHRAQTSGHDNFKFYSDAMYQEVVQREHMARALREAVERNEFTVVYQPLADFQSGRISGMEALLRWNSPEQGAIPPSTFIPLAEETGTIRAIGQWVLRQVCRDIRAWSDQGLEVPLVAVNVSAVQFRDAHYIASVRAVLDECGVAPQRLFLEVTESALMDDVQRCEAVLAELKTMGFGLSLDDFGTGYSSLSYLKRYPFDKVKIDQSFVREIDSNEVDAVIVKVIIAMAHGLGLKVVAEGVETEKQCEIMRSNVCDEIQGYFLSRPVDAAALAQLLAQGHCLPGHLLRFRPPQRTLLLVDDEPNVVSSLKRLFRRDGYAILTANSGEEGLQVLAQSKVDVIISDQRMPGMTGVELLREAKKRYPDTIRIVLSGFTELQSVTDAINEGAIYRFLTKPWVDEQLREQVHKAFEHVELLEQNRQLDIKIRTTNQELMAANRHLGALIEATRRQVQTETASLAVLREALQLIPTPILGVDDQMVIMFTNDAADLALVGWGGLLGCPLHDLDAELAQWLAEAPQGQGRVLRLAGLRWGVAWRSMGKTSTSRGTLLSLQPLPEPVQGGAP